MPSHQDDDDEPYVFNTYREGKIHVLTKKCSTCIFNPATRPVAGALVAGLVRDTIDDDGATVICHQTFYEPDGVEQENAICRGWFDRFAKRDGILRMAQAFDAIKFQKPPQGHSPIHPIGNGVD